MNKIADLIEKNLKNLFAEVNKNNNKDDKIKNDKKKHDKKKNCVDIKKRHKNVHCSPYNSCNSCHPYQQCHPYKQCHPYPPCPPCPPCPPSIPNDSIIYFNNYNNLINYKLPSRTSSYTNIITNINNFSSLIDDSALRGLNGTIYAIVADEKNGIIYIGGDFSMAGNTSAAYIVSYNINTGIFLPLIDSVTSNQGTDNSVLCLAFDSVNSKLYLGGTFTYVGGTIIASRIASWDISSSTFSPLTESGTNYEGADDSVRCLAIDSVNSILYFGGEISRVTSGTIITSYIAMWYINTSTFSPLTDSSTMGQGVNSSIYSLTINSLSNILYIGGAFTIVGGTIEANCIASWNNLTSTFSVLNDSETGINGTNAAVYSLAFNPVKNILYAGGSFDFAGGKMSQFVSSYEITLSHWVNLEAGIQKIEDTLKPIVNSLYLDVANQILYTGGNYSQTSGINTNNVSVYDINNKLWTPLVENKGRYNGITNGSTYYNVNLIKSICKLTDCLFIGGEFNMGGNVPVNNITKVKLNYILNPDGSKIFINNKITILKYNSTNNKWNIIY
jgi:hypothetical protein